MTSAQLTTAQLRQRVDAQFPSMIQELADLVAIPSISSDPDHADDMWVSARHVASRLEQAGLSVDVRNATTPDGVVGRPAVVAHSTEIPGAPTVLLYAHHDVQPIGDATHWDTDPFVLTEKDGRLYGRGASDDGAGIIVHLGALKALGEDLPVNVAIFIEGEEESGSPSFTTFVAENAQELNADVIIVCDSNNWAPGIPAITTTLRGNGLMDVTVKVLEHGVHSGQFGGPILDAVTVAAHLISTLHDENGDVAIPGLDSCDSADVEWAESDFRDAAGVLDGYQLAGTGDLAARAWTKPAINVIGMDGRTVAQSGNMIQPECTFRLSIRFAPTQDPEKAMALIKDYIEAHAPSGAHVTVTPCEAGYGFAADLDSQAAHLLRDSLREAWGGVEPVNTGIGGSIPFITDFTKQFPQAKVLVTGVEDPMTNAHSDNESQSKDDLHHAILAEALLLLKLAGLQK